MEKYNLILIKVSIVFAIISIVSLVMFGITAQSLVQPYWFVFAISVTFITVVLGFLQVFNLAREVRKKRTGNHNGPLKVTLEVNGDPITIESSNTEQIADIVKLIQDLQFNQSSHTQVKARTPTYLTTSTLEEKVALLEIKEEIASTSHETLEIEVLQKSEIDE